MAIGVGVMAIGVVVIMDITQVTMVEE